jgi:hypothetical protein
MDGPYSLENRDRLTHLVLPGASNNPFWVKSQVQALRPLSKPSDVKRMDYGPGQCKTTRPVSPTLRLAGDHFSALNGSTH